MINSKNLIATLSFIFICLTNSVGQTFISYETHAIQADYVHITQKIENVEPGMSGDKCYWDFSKLKCGNVSFSKIQNAIESPQSTYMENANLVIGEPNNQAFYKVDQNRLEYLGYTSENAIITLDKPIVRMKYPFKYTDKFEGTFYGTGIHYGTVYTSIAGNYSIEADGKGTLLLPNGVSINNAFRVKSIEYFTEASCKTSEWTITKYLWYTKDYRYPIFSIVRTEINDGEKVTNSNNAYYNDHAVTKKSLQSNELVSEMRLSVYPNPTVDKINIRYFIPKEQKVSIEIFTIAGAKVKDLVVDQKQIGEYKFEFSAIESGLLSGVYLINFTFGEKSITQRFILED